MDKMDLIGTEELKEKLDRGTTSSSLWFWEWEYRAKHIPGSLRVSTVEEGAEALDPDDEIVFYDSGPYCVASRILTGSSRKPGTST
jgi:hypothetical protein